MLRKDNIMISIAMTTFNGEKFLKEQIDSILTQSISSFELIIVDDCSTDSTIEILREYEIIDSRIRLVENETNLGFIKNFEKAVSLCNGEYIAFSDQDDIWTKDHLKILLDEIEDNLLVCANSQLFSSNKDYKSLQMFETLTLDFIPSDKDMFFYLLFNNFIQGSATLITRKLLDYVPTFPENDGFYHDHWLGIYAAYNGSVKYVNKSILLYRQHESNVTTNNKRKFITLIGKYNGKKIANLRFELLKKFQTCEEKKKYNIELEMACKYYQQDSFFNRVNSFMFLLKNYKKIYSVRNKRYILTRGLKLLFIGN